MPVTAPLYSSTALVPIVVPCSTWSIARRGRSKRAHRALIPATTPRDGSSFVVGVLWIKVRLDSVSANTMSVKVPPTSTPIRYIRSSYCLAGVRAKAFPAAAHCNDTQQTCANDKKGQARRHRTQGVNDRGGGVGLHCFELERQRVQRPDRLRGSRDLVVGQRETEQRDPDQARSDDRYDDVPDRLRAPRTQIARRLLVSGVEAVEHRQHDEEAKRQGPGEVGTERRAVPGPLDPEHFKHSANAEADHDRRHHQAGDNDIKQGGGAGKNGGGRRALRERRTARSRPSRSHREQSNDRTLPRCRRSTGAGTVRRTNAPKRRSLGRRARPPAPGRRAPRWLRSGRKGTRQRAQTAPRAHKRSADGRRHASSQLLADVDDTHEEGNHRNDRQQ